MRSALLWVALLLAGTLFQLDVQAQEKDSKIRIKVQTNENGNTKTFEKEYNSREEMLNDPEYKEFFGTDSKHIFKFGDDDNRFHFNFDVDDKFQWIDSLKGSSGNSFFFKSDGDDTDDIFLKIDSTFKNGNLKLFYNGDEGDASSFSLKFDSSMKDLREQMDKLREEMDANVFFFDGNTDLDSMDFSFDFKDLSDRFKGIDSGVKSIIIIKRNVFIEDLKADDKELQKLSNKRNRAVELEDFNYYPNPSDGRFTIKFKVEDESPLAVKIYSLSGKEIYGESYDSFVGTFKSDIDVSKHEQGIYLLEITQGNKVTNKKLIIE